MTEKDLKKLSRADLLQMMIAQSEELQTLRERLQLAEGLLKERELQIDNAGSIAEASLRLNGVFEAAQAACDQYIDNIRLLSDRQEAVCRRREEACQRETQRMLADAQARCEAMEAQTRQKCEEMLRAAKVESQSYWAEVSGKLDAYYAQHAGLKELLTRAFLREE